MQQYKLTGLDFRLQFPKLPPSPLYLIHGEDEYYKEQCLRFLIDTWAPPSSRDFDYAVFYGGEAPISLICEQLDILPFLAENRVVVVKEVDKYDANSLKALLPYLENPVPNAILILTAVKMDERLVFFKTIDKQGHTIKCPEPKYPKDLRLWLERELKQLNRAIEPRAMEFFIQQLPFDYYLAWQELQKLLLITEEGKPITYDSVKASLGVERSNSIFDLQNAVGSRNLKESLTILTNMLSAGEQPIAIISILTNYYLLLWRIQIYRSQHLSDQEIISIKMKREINAYFGNTYLQAAKQYPLAVFPDLFQLLAQIDTDMKSLGQVKPEILMTQFIYQIVQIGRS